jgi:hypothetical protein
MFGERNEEERGVVRCLCTPIYSIHTVLGSRHRGENVYDTTTRTSLLLFVWEDGKINVPPFVTATRWARPIRQSNRV